MYSDMTSQKPHAPAPGRPSDRSTCSTVRPVSSFKQEKEGGGEEYGDLFAPKWGGGGSRCPPNWPLKMRFFVFSRHSLKYPAVKGL